MEKKKIVIIGGGTAGASSLAFLQKKLGHICDIEMIASHEIPIVGVGEATVGNINIFLEMCGLDPEKTCLGDARGSIKFSVHCKDWFRYRWCRWLLILVTKRSFLFYSYWVIFYGIS